MAQFNANNVILQKLYLKHCVLMKTLYKDKDNDNDFRNESI